MIEYFKARWAQYRAEELALNKKLSKIKTGRPYETSITTHMRFYVGCGYAFTIGVIMALFIIAAVVALINAGLWFIAGIIAGV